jgi:hypothetical protein
MAAARAFTWLACVAFAAPSASAQYVSYYPTTSYYPAAVVDYCPVTTYYQPSVAEACPVTSYYAPLVAESCSDTAYYAPWAAPAPVTSYYVPFTPGGQQVVAGSAQQTIAPPFQQPTAVVGSFRVPAAGNAFVGSSEPTRVETAYRGSSQYTKVTIENATGTDGDFQVYYVDDSSRRTRKSPITRIANGDKETVVVEGRIEPGTSGKLDIYAIGTKKVWANLSGSAVAVTEASLDCQARELAVRLEE